MINLTDLLQGKFLEEFAAISLDGMLIAIALSFVLSLFIVLIYRITYTGVSFNKNFAACMVMITMVTTVVILVITSNVVLSLGMVGALSIVRFRTAVKEPADTAFLFWAIATGILCGAGYVTISILGTLLLGLLFVTLRLFGKKTRGGSCMVVVRFDADCQADQKIANLPGYRMKNLNLTGETTELVAEVQMSTTALEMITALRKEPGVREITIMESVNGSVL